MDGLDAEEFGEDSFASFVHLLLVLLAKLVSTVWASVHTWKQKYSPYQVKSINIVTANSRFNSFALVKQALQSPIDSTR